MPRALVLSKLGEVDQAVEMANGSIATFESLRIGGLNLAAAHELRAKVALEAHEQATFDIHAALAGKQRRGGRHGLAGAKYAQLAQQSGTVDVIGALTEQVSVVSQFTTILESCKSSGERAERGLDMLMRSSGAVGGVLYCMRAQGSERVAHAGQLEPDARMDALARDYLASEIHDENETRVLEEASAVTSFTREWRGEGTVRYVPVLLSHQVEQGTAISGVAVLMVDGTGRFAYPAALASELSRLCHEAGDIAVWIV